MSARIFLLLLLVADTTSWAQVPSGLHAGADSWSRTSSSLKSVAETYKKWGITFGVDGSKKIEPGDYMPEELEISGGVESPDHVHLSLSAAEGEEGTERLEVEGTFTLGPEEQALAGKGEIDVAGRGISGEFTFDKTNGLTLEAGLKESLYSVGIQLGKADEGPLSLGIHLGPFSVSLDPVKYAERLREVGPELASKIGDKIGGVSLRVDADALAAALENAPRPPARFLEKRYLVPMDDLKRQLSHSRLNRIQGCLLDKAHHRIYLVGVHDPLLPPLDSSYVVALANAIYIHHEHPFVSINPTSPDFSQPHRAEIGGIPASLANSPMTQAMLHADYSMKQLSIGTRSLPGIKSLMDVLKSVPHPDLGMSHRFWINPAPMNPGDLLISKNRTKTLYLVHALPLVSTQAYRPFREDSNPRVATDDPGARHSGFSLASQIYARYLTRHYRVIEKAWPQSAFAASEQTIEIASVMSTLATFERQPWVREYVEKLSKVPVPSVVLPKSFPGLTSPEPLIKGAERITVVGGMTTTTFAPDPVGSKDSLVDDPINSQATYLTPQVFAPVLLSTQQMQEQNLLRVSELYAENHFRKCIKAALNALSRDPDNLSEELMLLSSKAQTQGFSGFMTELDFDSLHFNQFWQFRHFKSRIYILMGHYQKSSAGVLASDLQAKTEAEDGLKIQPDSVPLLEDKGLAAHLLSQEKEAISTFDRAIRILKSSSDRKALAQAFLEKGGVEAAAGLNLAALDDIKSSFLIIGSPQPKRGAFEAWVG